MKAFKGKGFLFSFLILILMAWASTAYVAEKSPYKIGVNFEFTGPWAEVTKLLKNAMILEVERINKEGGVDGHPLELMFEDNGFDVGRVASNITKFTQDKEILACDRAPVKSPAGPSGPAGPVAAAPESARAPGAAPDFAERSARLASVPAGHEMGEARFSADGRHVAFVATRDGTAFVFLDAKRYGPYEEARGLFFPGGRSGLAFVARRGGREFVVVDGVEGAGYGAVATVLSAPDGRMVYSARRDDRWLVVAGAREAAVPGAADPWPCVSTDGRRVVYTERQGLRLFTVRPYNNFQILWCLVSSPHKNPDIVK